MVIFIQNKIICFLYIYTYVSFSVRCQYKNKSQWKVCRSCMAGTAVLNEVNGNTRHQWIDNWCKTLKQTAKYFPQENPQILNEQQSKRHLHVLRLTTQCKNHHQRHSNKVRQDAIVTLFGGNKSLISSASLKL